MIKLQNKIYFPQARVCLFKKKKKYTFWFSIIFFLQSRVGLNLSDKNVNKFGVYVNSNCPCILILCIKIKSFADLGLWLSWSVEQRA